MTDFKSPASVPLTLLPSWSKMSSPICHLGCYQPVHHNTQHHIHLHLKNTKANIKKHYLKIKPILDSRTTNVNNILFNCFKHRLSWRASESRMPFLLLIKIRSDTRHNVCKIFEPHMIHLSEFATLLLPSPTKNLQFNIIRDSKAISDIYI